MKKLLILGLFGLAAMAQSGADLFQRAMMLEREGRLPEAVKLFEKIAKDFAKDRPLAAKALVQAALGYEKQGEANALSLYERVAKEYSDQTDPARTAKAKVAALKVPPVPVRREVKLEIDPVVTGIVATDGQEAIYWRGRGEELVRGDLGGKNKRVLIDGTTPRPKVFPSNDLSMVLLNYPSQPAIKARWVVMKTDGTARRELGDLTGDADGAVWSWDNQYALLGILGRNVRKLTLATGQVEELRNTDNITLAHFSPDSRHVALQTLDGRVQTMAVDGSDRKTILKGGLGTWMRDGHLVFARPEENGRPALFTVATQNGVLTGEPARLMTLTSDLVRPWATSGGALVLRRGGQASQRTMVSSLDDTGKLKDWKTLELDGEGAYPDWSADGTQLVYNSNGAFNSFTKVRSLTLATGTDRELNRHDGALFQCFWGARPSEVFCSDPRTTESQVITDIYSFPTNGEPATKIAELDGIRLIQHITADGKFIDTMRLAATTGQTFHKLDIEKRTDEQRPPGFVSADRRWGFTLNSQVLTVFPLGEFADKKRDIPIDLPRSRASGPVAIKISGDGEWVVYQNHEGDQKFGLYRVRTSGGDPERLGDFPAKVPGAFLSLSPDNRQFLVQVPSTATPLEYTVLENFLPQPAAAKR